LTGHFPSYSHRSGLKKETIENCLNKVDALPITKPTNQQHQSTEMQITL